MIYSIIKESPEEEGKVQCRQLARTVVHHSVAQMLPAAYCSNLSGANLSCMLCSWSELSLPIGVDEFSFWKVRLGLLGRCALETRSQISVHVRQSPCTDIYIYIYISFLVKNLDMFLSNACKTTLRFFLRICLHIFLLLCKCFHFFFFFTKKKKKKPTNKNTSLSISFFCCLCFFFELQSCTLPQTGL